MPTLYSSSPDPLAAANGPSIAPPTPSRRSLPPVRQPARPLLSTPTTAVDITPRKMTSTSHSMLSPWRIKVIVEAERDSGEEDNGLPPWDGRATTITVPVHGLQDIPDDAPAFKDARRKKASPARKRSPSKSKSTLTRTTTTTTKVPLKGLDSSPDAARGRTAVRKPTPRRSSPAVKKTQPAAASTGRRKRAVAETSRDRGSSVHPESMLSQTAVEDDTELSIAAQPKSKRPRRKSITKSQEPTLASTRSRRSSAFVGTFSGLAQSPRPAKKSRPSSGIEDTIVVSSALSPRPALMDKDRNAKLSSPAERSLSELSKKNKSSRMLFDTSSARKRNAAASRSMRESSFMSDIEINPEDVIDSNNFHDEMAPLPDLPGVSSGDDDDDDDEMVDEGFTYIATGPSYTPRRKKSHTGLDQPEEKLFEDNPVGVESFYGQRDGEEYDEEQSSDDEQQGMENIFPSDPEEELAAEDEHIADEETIAGDEESMAEDEEMDEPHEADFTHMPDGASYTPRPKKRHAGIELPENLPLFEDSVGVDSFYGLPESSGQTPGQTPDRKGKGRAIKRSPLQAAEESLYPSSPPFHVLIENTPSKRVASPTLPEGPPSRPQRRRIDRDTPDLTRVVEGSSMLSDAVEVSEPMEMRNQEFGSGITRPAQQPTPESEGYGSMSDDGTNADDRTKSSQLQFSSPPSSKNSPNSSTLLSPPQSQDAEPEVPPHRRPLLSSPKSALRSTPTKKKRSWWPLGAATTPSGRSVHFNEDPVDSELSPPALEGQSVSLASLEAEWAREREENAQEVGAITILPEEDESSHRLNLELDKQWAREREDVRQKAAEVGAITIGDSSETMPSVSPAADKTVGGSSFLQDTAAFEESLAKHIANEEKSVVPSSPSQSDVTASSEVVKAPTKVPTTKASISSHPTSPPTTVVPSSTTGYPDVTTRERALIQPSSISSISSATSDADDLTPAATNGSQNGQNAKILPSDLLSFISEAPSTTSCQATASTSTASATEDWTSKEYQHLLLILRSSRTIPIPGKRLAVELIDPKKNLPDVIDRLYMDTSSGKESNFMILTELETAAVGRFLSREKRMGNIWEEGEAARGVASMVIARKRREARGVRGLRW